MSLASFIQCFENSIPNELCDQIIRRFEKDHRKEKGLIAGGVYDETRKVSAELGITPLSNWKDIDMILYNIHHDTFQVYLKDLSENLQDTYPVFDLDSMEDDGYVICKFPSDIGFLDWNNNLSTKYSSESGVRTRVYGFIWFLTDMQLYFSHDKENPIEYKKGSLIFYPILWTFMYKIPKSIGIITNYENGDDNRNDIECEAEDRYMIYGFITTKVM